MSFCTREHFGSIGQHEDQKYVRFAYSGIASSKISEGLDKFIEWINRDDV